MNSALTRYEVSSAARGHALSSYPAEACGVVLETGYCPLENVAREPTEHFDCTAQIALYLETGAALALIHSHPDGPDHPSVRDMAQQVAMDLPWGLVVCDATDAMPLFYWSDDFEPPPLVGRPFRYGPSGTDGKGDCAALVRDWYRVERGVHLPEYPRESRAWVRPGVSYAENLRSAGFLAASMDTPEVGDVFTGSIRSKDVNHAGIYAGEGKILHHLEGRLSAVEPLIGMRRFINGWYRYHG